MTDHPNSLTICLLWHSVSSDNLGVGALTLGQLELLLRASSSINRVVRFVVVGTRGNTPYEISGFNISQTGEFALRAFRAGDFSAISILRSSDIVFDIGEGDSFADIYGVRRLSIQVFAKLLARVFGKFLILSPQTIGPFKTLSGRVIGKFALLLARRVYARDGLSRQCVESLGYGGRCEEVIDVAFALPYEIQVLEKSVTRVGINVSGLLYNGGYDGKNSFGLALDYKILIERCCEYFLSLPATEVYLVPHVISDAIPVENDFFASEKLRLKYPRLKIAPRFNSPVTAKSFISGMDFFTGARMHACIAAFSSGVPVVPMAYSRKFQGLFNSLGYERIVDCLSSSIDDALVRVIEAFESKEILKAEVGEGNRIAAAKLAVYVSSAAEILSELCPEAISSATRDSV